MSTPSEFQSRRGTVLATFATNGTYSAPVDMGGLNLVGLYSDNWPSAAGSLTFRSTFDPLGTGWPILNEGGAPYRVSAFGSGSFVQFQPGSAIVAAQYLTVQVGTAGTAGVAAGGTIVLIGAAQ
jgi:hypothetical protein